MVEVQEEDTVYREDPPVDIQIAIEPRKRKPKKRRIRHG
jgi:hypothetical protein